MLYWIAKKYHNWAGIDSEDMEADLWIKTLQLLKNSQSETIEYNLIAKCCYNHAKDILRKAKKLKEKQCSADEESLIGLSENLDEIDTYYYGEVNAGSRNLAKNNLSNASVMVTEMLKLFEDDQKAYNLVRLVALYYHVDIPINRNEGWTFESKFGTHDTYENEIAKALGYANSMSSGYRVVRQRVRDKLYSHGYRDLF